MFVTCLFGFSKVFWRTACMIGMYKTALGLDDYRCLGIGLRTKRGSS